jgi:hypothetical protein
VNRFALVLLLTLAGCSGAHRPDREGVYIERTANVVTCDRDGAAILCRTVPASFAQP